MSCEHLNSTKKRVEHTYFGIKFRPQMSVCDICGFALWDEDVQTKFDVWLAKTHKKFPNKFSVKYAIPKKCVALINDIIKKYPGSTEAVVVRAILASYFKVIDHHNEVAGLFNTVLGSPEFRKFSTDDRITKSLRLKPNLLLDVSSYASLANSNNAWVIESILIGFCVVIQESSSGSNSLALETISDQIETILKAA